jgi:hypothetical protein
MMQTTVGGLRPACAVLGLLLAGSAADAQEAPRDAARTLRGLFTGEVEPPRRAHTLGLTFSGSGNYDDNAVEEHEGAVRDPRFQIGGYYAGGAATLSYRWLGQRRSLDIDGGATGRYYPKLSRLTSVSPWATFTASLSPGPRTTLRATQFLSYSPYYVYGAADSASTTGEVVVLAPNADFAVRHLPVVALATTAEVTRQVTRRSSLTAFGSLAATRFRDEGPGFRDFTHRGGGGRFARVLGRTLAFHVGYGYREAVFGHAADGAAPVVTHDLDIGLDYSGALSRSRRTTFGFSTGSAVVAGGGPGRREHPGRYYLWVGTAHVAHDIGRTWRLRADYGRRVYLLQGLSDPVIGDGASATVAGRLARRVELLATASRSAGQVGLEAARDITIYSGTLRLQYVLTSRLAVFGESYSYRSRFGTAPVGYPALLDRTGVRAGLVFAVPLAQWGGAATTALGGTARGTAPAR